MKFDIIIFLIAYQLLRINNLNERKNRFRKKKQFLLFIKKKKMHIILYNYIQMVHMEHTFLNIIIVEIKEKNN